MKMRHRRKAFWCIGSNRTSIKNACHKTYRWRMSAVKDWLEEEPNAQDIRELK